jgi:uncharacterized repeat protein (TIGR03803 family)
MIAAGLLLATGFVLPPVVRTRAAQGGPQTPTYTVLFNFAGLGGSLPNAGVIADAAGNLYGTTFQGGTHGYGTVYELPATGGETVLYSFTGGSDGALPYAPLIRDAGGNLYGTAGQGGTFNSTCPYGCGVVFKLTPERKEKVLYSFTGGSDGNEPVSNLVRDAAGNLYGSTAFGGITDSCVGYGGTGLNGCGVVFKVGKAQSEAVLYSFTGGSDGATPGDGLIQDAAGDIYGTTHNGGDISSCSGFGCGVVYKLATSGSETVLYTFTGESDGANPDSGVIQDAAGNFYGTTANGGDFSCGVGYGCGVVFELPSGGNETVLYTFTGPDGASPAGAVVRDGLGNLYGTAAQGGTNNSGAIFKLSSAGKETVLHSFSGADGALPLAGLLAYKGVLYGTTYDGGSGGEGDGVLFKITP